MFQKILDKVKKKPVVKNGVVSTRGSLPEVPENKEAKKTEKKDDEGKVEEKKINKKGKKREFEQGLVSTKDIIAPSALQVDFDYVRIGNRYYRTLFVSGYPRFVGLNWLSPLVNFDSSLNVSMYIYPTDGKEILDDLRRKIAEMEAEISTDIQRGRVVNPATQAKLEDALNLQTDLVKGEERFFQFGLYVTISAASIDELDQTNKNLEAALGSLMIISKRTTLQMEEGFNTTLPTCNDELDVTRNMDTTSLATTFPFVSSDLSDDKGIMYGINEHNGSLVIFDRFSMPNYNSVVFATSGVGKSYLIKLEAMRSLMMGTEIIVIDPENEYKTMCEAVGGQYIAFGYGEASKINPFDLSLAEEEGENALNTKILSLHKLLKVMLGKMDPIEESILDKALMAAYRAKGITPDPETQNKEAPLIEDLYKALIGMEEAKAKSLAARLEKFIKGSFAGIFNQKTTVDLKNMFVVFGIRNLEETLRPVAMHIVLDYIWTVVKRELKKRILIVDEAWYLMQYDDSAAFLRGIIKRGRKYFLGTTTITQDVDDFLETPYGKEIVTNSSIQILLKQHSAAIDKVSEVFYLSEGEKQLLLSADKGEGIFFAGQNHVALRVIASESEHQLITSDPEELVKQKKRIEEKLKEAKAKTKTKPAMDVQMRNEMAENETKKENKNQVDGLISRVKKAVVKVAKPKVGSVPKKASTPTAVSTTVAISTPAKISTPTETVSTAVPTPTASSTTVAISTPVMSGAKVRKPSSQAQVVVDNNSKASANPSVVPRPLAKVVNGSGQNQTKKEEVSSEVVEVGAKADLKKKIEKMEKEEIKKIEDFKKSQAEGISDSSGGLKKGVLYKDLGGSKVPRFVPPKVEPISTTDPGRPLGMSNSKPIFVNKQKGIKIPQPQQLLKKPTAQFGKTAGAGGVKPGAVKVDSKTEPVGVDNQKAGGKMDYDELLGN